MSKQSGMRTCECNPCIPATTQHCHTVRVYQVEEQTSPLTRSRWERLPGLQDKGPSIHAALEADGDVQDLPALVHLVRQQLRSARIRLRASAQGARTPSSASAWHCQHCRMSIPGA